MNVAVLGASNKPSRYSYQAVELLMEHGHAVFPVHPKIGEVAGLAVSQTLGDVAEPIDTLTLYVSPAISNASALDILECGARRIIFNPGTENPELARRLEEQGAETVEAGTLVMLRLGQF